MLIGHMTSHTTTTSSSTSSALTDAAHLERWVLKAEVMEIHRDPSHQATSPAAIEVNSL